MVDTPHHHQSFGSVAFKVCPVNAANTSPSDAIRSYVEATTVPDEILTAANEAADEFGLLTPDAMTAELLTFLAARAAGNGGLAGHTPTGIVMSPACGVIGLHLFRGLTGGHITCIEPEVQHQQIARAAFEAAGVRNNMFRFLPSTPLDVVGRLAQDSYDIAVTDCPEEDLLRTVEATLPALRPGGVLILLDSLLDGLLGDTSRTDRQTVAAREADETLREMEGITVARLPLGAGATLITKNAR